MFNEKNIVTDETVIELIEQFGDFNHKDKTGINLLMTAVIYQRPLIVEYLLNKGIDVNEKEKMEFTALHFAVQEKNLEDEILKLLLDNGADFKMKNNFGVSTLDVLQVNRKSFIEQYI